MNKKDSGGYQEIPHTADLELQVWGADLEELYLQAADGLYDLLQLVESDSREVFSSEIQLQAMDLEGLLIVFLEELLFMATEEQIACQIVKMQIKDQGELQAELKARRISGFQRDIKAVTYHNIDIRKSRDGYTVNIVFDI